MFCHHPESQLRRLCTTPSCISPWRQPSLALMGDTQMSGSLAVSASDGKPMNDNENTGWAGANKRSPPAPTASILPAAFHMDRYGYDRARPRFSKEGVSGRRKEKKLVLSVFIPQLTPKCRDGPWTSTDLAPAFPVTISTSSAYTLYYSVHFWCSSSIASCIRAVNSC